MALTSEYPAPTAPLLPPARTRPLPLRVRVLGRALTVMLTAGFAVGLIALWLTLVAVSPLTLVAPLVLPATALVRAYAGVHRRAAAGLVGSDPRSPYRPTAGQGVVRRVLTVVTDPASWRDLWWLVVHALAGFFLATLSVVLLLGGVFYAIYPFLYAVTPQRVFGRPFGGWLHLHDVAQAACLVPVGLVLLAVWWVVAVPLARAEATLDARLLAAR